MEHSEIIKLQQECYELKNLASEYDKILALQNEILKNVQYENDELQRTLREMETSFSNLFGKYEKCKSVFARYKPQDKELYEHAKEVDEILKINQKKYESVKEHATKMFDNGNSEIEQMYMGHKEQIMKQITLLNGYKLKYYRILKALEYKTKQFNEIDDLIKELAGN